MGTHSRGLFGSSRGDEAPLLSARLMRSLSGTGGDGKPNRSERSLNAFNGVFCPVVLSMFSVLLFLRIGFVVGQAGVLESAGLFALSYLILGLTVLSICAISTNGAIDGGGCYYMISRALGPEFGGSIGTLFFFANVFSSALYTTGCVEGIVDNFGPGGFLGEDRGLPEGRWWSFLYGTCITIFNCVICLVGAKLFARMSMGILAVVMVSALSVVISIFVNNYEIEVSIPKSNMLVYNSTTIYGPFINGTYTGLSSATLRDNLFSNYTRDYTTGKQLDFATVFAVLFSGVTGVMAGANMSGDLKEPSRAIPRGTLAAVAFTFVTYLIITLLVAASCEPFLLKNNYILLQDINLWPPFVAVGIFAATWAAALSNLIGASRILEAVARDRIFGILLAPVSKTTTGGNPWVAVLVSWFLVMCVLLIGSLNQIAEMASIFFLFSYTCTNLATLGLELASAPNFRPTFRYYSWHTSLLGCVGTLVMMFFINFIYASISIILFIILFMILHYRAPLESWGSISQALMFHQVRKYLLLLDSRKDHVKFWRPNILLMVANPRSCCELIHFVNDLKKGGMFLLGSVQVGRYEDVSAGDPCLDELPYWLGLVDHLRVKAFVELTMAPSVREGMWQLIRIGGLGAMKPNTIILGFYDSVPPQDSFVKQEVFKEVKYASMELKEIQKRFLSRHATDRQVNPAEYVLLMQDCIRMGKSLCLARNFHLLNKDAINRSSEVYNIDAWPINFLEPQKRCDYDTTCLFLLQLACILSLTNNWKRRTRLRVFLCIDPGSDDTMRMQYRLEQLLQLLRITASIDLVAIDDCMRYLKPEESGEPNDTSPTAGDGAPEGGAATSPEPNIAPLDLPQNYLQAVNQLLADKMAGSAVCFLYLPLPPGDSANHMLYLQQLQILTEGLPPSLLVHGIHLVTSTAL